MRKVYGNSGIWMGRVIMKSFFSNWLIVFIFALVVCSGAINNPFMVIKAYAATASKWEADYDSGKKIGGNQRTAQKETPKAVFDQNKINSSGIINIVFFGLDGGNKNGYSRSDTIMVVSIDEKRNKLKVTSLMRDMYVPIPGKGSNKINAAYASGGPSLAIKTINTNFGLNIKDYVTVDFSGLEKLIDMLGGIEVKLSKAEADTINIEEAQNHDLKSKVQLLTSGNQKLTGSQAVLYCRIRYVGHADFERTERQRRVLNELLKKLKQRGIKEFPELVSAMLPYVKTSLSAGDIIKLGIKGIRLKTESIVQYRLPVEGAYKSQYINKMAVLVPDIEVNKKKILEFIYD